MRTLYSTLAALAAGLVLTACGGGSSGDGGMTPLPPQPATVVPDSAMASPAALVGYLAAEPSSDDSSEALALPKADAAATETDEPLPVS